jgi:muramoyltetrapeptide carboxypeptidase
MQRRDFTNMLALSPMLMLKYEALLNAKKTIALQPLKIGDTVGLIAPGSPIKEEKFSNALANMERMGLKIKYSPNVFKKSGYLAGDDESRLNDIHAMFLDKEVKAIWCLRGGYGCTRIMPYLDYGMIKNNPKILIGYSDITALLLAINKKTGLKGFHAAVAISELFSEYTFEHTRAMLFNEKKEFYYESKIQQNEKFKQEPYTILPGQARGAIIAGNLSLLCAMIGGAFAPSYKNKIVFIEEVGEKPYRIDRMLTQLIQSTDIAKCAGIVLGVFSDCEAKAEDQSFSLKEVLVERFKILNKPCFYGFPFGHVGDITPLPIGGQASIDAEKMNCKIFNCF